jgi:hypothetical protein
MNVRRRGGNAPDQAGGAHCGYLSAAGSVAGQHRTRGGSDSHGSGGHFDVWSARGGKMQEWVIWWGTKRTVSLVQSRQSRRRKGA